MWPSQIGRRELVFLEVLGFKELEALLHRQAFLQTLYRAGVKRRKEKQAMKMTFWKRGQHPNQRDGMYSQAKKRQEIPSSIRLEEHA